MTKLLRSLVLLAVAAAAVITTPSFFPGASQKLDRALRERVALGPSGPVRIIVRAASGAVGALRETLRARGAQVLSEQPSLESITAQVQVDELTALANDARVAALSFDAPVTSQSSESDALLLETLGIDDNRSGYGVGIAIIDSGFEPAATSNFSSTNKFYDFTQSANGTAQSASAYDNYGHGTHIAGLIASDGDASNGLYRGLAPGAKLIILKALDQNGQGYTSTVVNAINFAVANKSALGIDIINLSLGHPIYEPAASDPLVQAVEQAVRAGIVVVVSAGNNGGDPQTHEVGYAGINSPGNAPSAITVGAFDMAGTPRRSDDTIPWYSSRGPTWYDGFQKPDLVAPGHKLVSDIDKTSTLYSTYPQYIMNPPGSSSGRFFRLSGTSMSAGVVSGAAALVIRAGRNEFGKALPPHAVKAVLQYTAIAMPGYDTLTQGAGALNVGGALTLAKALDPRRAVNSCWLTVGVTPSTWLGGTSLSWAQRLVWGDRVVWGDQIYTNDPAWAQSIVWGDRLVWGDRVVWGDSTVWSNASRVVWGDRLIWGDSLLGYVDGSRVVWGDSAGNTTVDSNRVVWGNVAESTLSGLSTPEDKFGFSALEDPPRGKYRRPKKESEDDHEKGKKDHKGHGHDISAGGMRSR